MNKLMYCSLFMMLAISMGICANNNIIDQIDIESAESLDILKSPESMRIYRDSNILLS